MARKKEYLLRMDAQLFEEIQTWAAGEFRSVNGQIEFLLNQALSRRRDKNVLHDKPEDDGLSEDK